MYHTYVTNKKRRQNHEKTDKKSKRNDIKGTCILH